jgi:hypothetical protein
MLIDSLRPLLSGQSTTKQLGSDQHSILAGGFDPEKGLIRTAGWVLDRDHMPDPEYHATVTVPYWMFPSVTPPGSPPGSLSHATCSVYPFLRFDGVRYSLYNPYTQTPDNSTDCQMVPLGDSPNETADNLAGAIRGGTLSGTNWTGSARINGDGDADGITITCSEAGPIGNGWQAIPDGRWGLSVVVTGGGGYRWLSRENRDANDDRRTLQYSVRVLGRVGGIGDQNHPPSTYVEFAFNFDPDAVSSPDLALHRLDSYGLHYTAGGIASYTGSQIGAPNPGPYRMVANPYSFGLWDDSEDASFAPGWRHCSLFAAAPYIPTEDGFTSARAAFVVGHPMRGALSYGSSDSTVVLDGAPARMYYSGKGGGYVRVLATRSGGGPPLTTPAGRALITNAWVMHGKSAGASPRVVGKLWDCAVVNDYVDGIEIDGKQYRRVSHQTGSGGQTQCSLVFCVPTSLPPGQQIDDPAGTAELKLYYAATVTSTASVAGLVTLTRVSGVHFNVSMVGGTWVEGFSSLPITSYIDEDHIVIERTQLVDLPETAGAVWTTIDETTGGGVIHYVTAFGTGDVTASATGEASMLTWRRGNYYFDDGWMLNRSIRVHGIDCTVTRIIDSRNISFWPALGGPITEVAWAVPG